MRLSTTTLGAVAAGLLVAASLLAGLNAAGARAWEGRGQAPHLQVSLLASLADERHIDSTTAARLLRAHAGADVDSLLAPATYTDTIAAIGAAETLLLGSELINLYLPVVER